MLNNFILVGKLLDEKIEVKEVDGKKVAYITVAVPRSFKNEEGEYEKDLVPVELWFGVAENVSNYCHKNDTLGVKGRIQVVDSQVKLIADKVTFLSSSSTDKGGEDNE